MRWLANNQPRKETEIHVFRETCYEDFIGNPYVNIVLIFILAVPRFQDVLATFQGAKSCLGEILSSCEFIDQVPNH
jgi:hypothetical protein